MLRADRTHTAMNAYLASLLRHCFTALASLGVFLAAKGLIAPADTAAVNDAGASIATALAVILAAIGSRLLLTVLAKMKISGPLAGTTKAPGWLPVLGTATLGGFIGFSLSGCATTVTKTTMPDGTVIEVTAKSSDPAAMDAATAVSGMLIPVLIHADK